MVSAALHSLQPLGIHAHSGAVMSVWLFRVFSRQLRRSCNPVSQHNWRVDSVSSTNSANDKHVLSIHAIILSWVELVQLLQGNGTLL